MRLPSSTTGSPDFSRENRFLLVRTLWHTITVYTPWFSKKSYRRVMFLMSRGSSKSVMIELTSLTEPELVAFSESVAIATRIALPIVRQLDAEAQKEAEDGTSQPDDRVYRALPTVVVRKRALGEHSEILLVGRESIFPGIQYHVDSSIGTPTDSSSVDEQEQEGS